MVRFLTPGAATLRCKTTTKLILVEHHGKALARSGGEGRKLIVGYAFWLTNVVRQEFLMLLFLAISAAATARYGNFVVSPP